MPQISTKPMISTSIVLTKEINDRLQQEADRRFPISRSQIIREALESYLGVNNLSKPPKK